MSETLRLELVGKAAETLTGEEPYLEGSSPASGGGQEGAQSPLGATCDSPPPIDFTGTVMRCLE